MCIYRPHPEAKARLKPRSNVRLLEGDGRVLLPEVIIIVITNIIISTVILCMYIYIYIYTYIYMYTYTHIHIAPEVLRQHADRRIAVFIDGPKGERSNYD